MDHKGKMCNFFDEEVKLNNINYISKNDLAKSLSVSVSTINRKLNEIPHVKLGDSPTSRVVFSVPQVIEYLENLSPNKKMSAQTL